MEAMDKLDEVVRSRGEWDAARAPVAAALRRAGLNAHARVADGVF